MLFFFQRESFKSIVKFLRFNWATTLIKERYIWPTQLDRSVKYENFVSPEAPLDLFDSSMTKNRWQQLLINAYGFLCDLRSVRLVSPKLVQNVEMCMNFTSAKPNTWHTSRWSGNGISRRNCQILAENRDYHVFGLRWGVGLQYRYFVVSTQQNSPTLRHRKLLSFCMNTFLLHLSSSYKLNVSFFYFKLMSWQSSFVL